MEEKQYVKPIDKSAKEPMGFGKTMLASALGMAIGFFVINIVGFFLMMVLIVGMAAGISSTSTDTVKVKPNTFLKLDLSTAIAERTPGELQQLFAEDESAGIIDILAALQAAQTDKAIRGIYLYLGAGSAQSWGQTEELRLALQEFKASSNKPIIAYADGYNQTGYYLASIADIVMMHPAGVLDWRGIAAQPMFYGDLLKKYSVEMDLIRPTSNAYKSAGETYTMNHMSEANKEQIRTYITSIWNHVVADISATRNLSVAELNTFADNLSLNNPYSAVAAGMIDTLGFEHDIKSIMKDRYKMKHMLDLTKYAKTISSTGDEKIAVVYAEGNVVTGTNKSGFQSGVFGDDVAKALDDAANDDDIKAIILRVNSPGGAVIASEIMTAAVMRAKAKKPVIVSMSDLAASAGYEISCNATKIVALPTTLTGSIGVFATIPQVGEALRKHLGITTDTVMTNANAGGVNGLRPMSPLTRKTMQQSIEDFYQTFIGRVAKGRGMKVEDVDQIARGRVWTGADAIKIGLVDTLGGFNTAVAIACQEAKIDPSDCRLVNFPEDKDLWNQILDITGSSEEVVQMRTHRLMGKELGSAYEDLLYFSTMEPMQARLPYSLDISR